MNKDVYKTTHVTYDDCERCCHEPVMLSELCYVAIATRQRLATSVCEVRVCGFNSLCIKVEAPFDRSACFTTNSKEIEVQCKLECGRCPT